MKLLLVSRMSKVDHQNKVLPIRVIEKKQLKVTWMLLFWI